jgi:hypothetical protein
MRSSTDNSSGHYTYAVRQSEVLQPQRALSFLKMVYWGADVLGSCGEGVAAPLMGCKFCPPIRQSTARRLMEFQRVLPLESEVDVREERNFSRVHCIHGGGRSEVMHPTRCCASSGDHYLVHVKLSLKERV